MIFDQALPHSCALRISIHYRRTANLASSRVKRFVFHGSDRFLPNPKILRMFACSVRAGTRWRITLILSQVLYCLTCTSGCLKIWTSLLNWILTIRYQTASRFSVVQTGTDFPLFLFTLKALCSLASGSLLAFRCWCCLVIWVWLPDAWLNSGIRESGFSFQCQ